MPTFFISHAAADGGLAEELRARLTERGFPRVFLAGHPDDGIKAGEEWVQSLYEGIRSCDAVLFLDSAESKESRWCHAELACAHWLDKRIVPLLVHGGDHHPLADQSQGWELQPTPAGWEALLDWLATSFDPLRARLQRAAEAWIAAGRVRAYLLQGDRLAEALEWERDAVASAEIGDLLAASRARSADRLAAEAMALETTDGELATLLALAAVTEYAPTVASLSALDHCARHALHRARLSGHQDAVRWCEFSPDGLSIVTASVDGTARIWSSVDSTEIAVLDDGSGSPAVAARYSPDGTEILVTNAAGTATRWDVATGRATNVLGTLDRPMAGSYAPDGGSLVLPSAGGAVAVTSPDGREQLRLTEHGRPVQTAEFSGDGRWIVTGSEDRTAFVWDATTGSPQQRLVGHAEPVACVAIGPAGRVVTAAEHGSARVWDWAAGRVLFELVGHERREPIRSVRFSPDGTRILTASRDGTARLWDAATGHHLDVLHGDRPLWRADFSPDGRHVVTACEDGAAHVWDAARSDTVYLCGHTARVHVAEFSPDGRRVVTASADGTARVWDAADGSELLRLDDGAAHVTSARYSPDGRLVVTAAHDGRARLWDAKTGEPLGDLSGHERRVWSARFSADGGRIVTASVDGTAHIWDAATHDRLATLEGHDDAVYSAAFSPDGTRVVTASRDRSARVWDAATGEPLLTLGAGGAGEPRAHSHKVWAASWSPDGERIVTTTESGEVWLWDGAGRHVLELAGHDKPVWSAAWSADSALLVTASEDRTARIWDPATGAHVLTLWGQDDEVNSAAFSPDGSQVVSAGDDGLVLVLGLIPPERRLTWARSRVSRALTADERWWYGLPGAEAPAPAGGAAR